MSFFVLLQAGLSALILLPIYLVKTFYYLLWGKTDDFEVALSALLLVIRGLTFWVYIIFLTTSALSLTISLYHIQPMLAYGSFSVNLLIGLLIILVGYAANRDTRDLQAIGVQYFLLLNGFLQTILWAIFSDVTYHEPLSVLSLLMAATAAFLNKNIVNNQEIDTLFLASDPISEDNADVDPLNLGRDNTLDETE